MVPLILQHSARFTDCAVVVLILAATEIATFLFVCSKRLLVHKLHIDLSYEGCSETFYALKAVGAVHHANRGEQAKSTEAARDHRVELSNQGGTHGSANIVANETRHCPNIEIYMGGILHTQRTIYAITSAQLQQATIVKQEQ
jgi:hypothetical protein